MSAPVLDLVSVRRALEITDLTDPEQGLHAMQLLIESIRDALSRAFHRPAEIIRRSPIVSIADNYDHLGYAPDAVARDARYSRYLCESALLRTHTTAMIPNVLRGLATSSADERIVLCPGIVYRRDAIDRHHSGEPHQLDVWRIRRGARLGASDLMEWIDVTLEAALPGLERRTERAVHPYTAQGLQIDVRTSSGWLEVAECGLAAPELLERHGLSSSSWSGLALGLGLDRLLMLRKGIPDIRLLRVPDPRVAAQMRDLSAYRAVSSMPGVRRDLSLVLDPDDTLESLGDRVRLSLALEAGVVESVEILSETPYEDLPDSARRRMGARPGQRNVLVRVLLRAYDRTLTTEECNQLRDRIYAALHRGERSEWATRP